MNNKRQITAWGLLDLSCLGWYLVLRLVHGQIPFHHEITESARTALSLGFDLPIIFIVMASALYVSLLFSGILLVMQRKSGAIIGYIQIPFRILTFIPPSLFFVTWPLGYIFGTSKTPGIVATAIVIIGSEVLKACSLTAWYRRKEWFQV